MSGRTVNGPVHFEIDFGAIFLEKVEETVPLRAHSKYKISSNGKLNVIKMSKIPFLGL